MKKQTLLALALSASFSLAQEAPAPTVQAPVAPAPATEAAQAAESNSLDRAIAAYQTAPQSVKNFYAYALANYYACAANTIEAFDAQAIETAYFHIFVQNDLYSQMPAEISRALPAEFQQYLAAVAPIWSASLAAADELKEKSEEGAFEEIYNQAMSDQESLLVQYPQVSKFTELVVEYLTDILFEEAGVFAALEAAADEPNAEAEKDFNAAKVKGYTIVSEKIAELMK